MASAWIRQRWTKGGSARWRVEYRLGGAGTKKRYAGSFPTKREALIRKAWVSGELAARRVPDLSAFAEPTPPTIVADAARRWLASRIDVAESTKTRNELEVERIDRLVGSVAVDALTPEQVATFVTDLVTEGYARGTIRKTLQTLAMILDRERINPNPVRDKQVKLPREDEEEINPPTAQHAEAVYWLLPSKHRLAFLFLDWSGARVSAIDHVIVSDYDEPRRRVRLRKSVTKTKRALWIDLPPVLAEAIEASLGPREDRDPDARLFAGSRSTSLRTSITRACKAAAVPHFKPHDPAIGESRSFTRKGKRGRGSASSSAVGASR
jgi:integrase